MDNLLEMIGNQVTPEVVSAASSMVGTTSAQTQSALGAGIPALVGSLLQQGSAPAGATQILETLSQQPSDINLGDFAAMLGNQESSDTITNMGGSIMSSLLGNNQEGVMNLISSVAGIDSDSSSSLMKILMPLGMAVLGQVVSGEKLDVTGLIGLLMGQKDFLKAAAPPGLTDALGIGSFDDFKMPDLSALQGAAAGAAGDAVQTASAATSGAASASGDAARSVSAAASGTTSSASGAAQKASGGIPTWAWVVIVIVVLFLLWWLLF